MKPFTRNISLFLLTAIQVFITPGCTNKTVKTHVQLIECIAAEKLSPKQEPNNRKKIQSREKKILLK